MEEKERFEYYFGTNSIKDNKTNKIYDYVVDLLNKQDKRIKELREENQQLIKALNGEVFINYKLPMENAQLKQQLAEKENTITTLIEDSKTSKELLKQQLKEKEKEIEKLTEELDDKNFCKDFVDLYTENKLKTQMLQENWKDKISFTIQQLEKVKEKLLEELQNVTVLLDPLEYEDYHELIGCSRGYKNSIEEIDNQINELKGEKNDKV